MTDAVTPSHPSGNNRPARPGDPDPTLLTIDSIRREIAMLENLFDSKLEAAARLRDEKFITIAKLLDKSEELRREQKNDTKLAVEAALASQKEAVAKTEQSMSGLLESLRTNFETSIGAVQSSLADIKERLTTIESRKQGQSDQKDERRQATSGVYAAIGIGVTLILFAITIVGFIMATGVSK